MALEIHQPEQGTSACFSNAKMVFFREHQIVCFCVLAPTMQSPYAEGDFLELGVIFVGRKRCWML